MRGFGVGRSWRSLKPEPPCCAAQGPGKKWEHLPVNKNGKVERQPIHVKLGDTVQVIAGKDKGKVGKVIKVQPLGPHFSRGCGMDALSMSFNNQDKARSNERRPKSSYTAPCWVALSHLLVERLACIDKSWAVQSLAKLAPLSLARQLDNRACTGRSS